MGGGRWRSDVMTAVLTSWVRMEYGVGVQGRSRESRQGAPVTLGRWPGIMRRWGMWNWRYLHLVLTGCAEGPMLGTRRVM